MKHFKICPRCGSLNIGVPKRGFDLVSMQDFCKDCGFIANFPEVEIEKIEEFRKEIKKEKHLGEKIAK